MGVRVKKVNILGEEYKIVRKLGKKYSESIPVDDYYGLCLREEKLIFINPKLKGKEYYRTLLHEMGHALQEANGMVYTCVLDQNLEEMLVETNAKMAHRYTVDLIKHFLKEKDGNILRSKLEEFCKS